MSARDKLHAYAGTPSVLPESMLDAALDAYRDEVLAENGEAYPGELAMLRGLVATLRVVAQHGDLADVVKLLDEHQRDEQDAYAEAPAVSDGPAGPTGRVARLLDAIRTARGRWTTARAAQFYRDCGIEPPGAQWSRTRTVARGDLRDLAAWGHLIRHEEPGRTYFVLKTRKGGA
jgi:hypothetical protein